GARLSSHGPGGCKSRYLHLQPLPKGLEPPNRPPSKRGHPYFLSDSAIPVERGAITPQCLSLSTNETPPFSSAACIAARLFGGGSGGSSSKSRTVEQPSAR